MFATAGIVAHQGGWDEMLLVAGPIVLIAGLLTLAKRRVDAAALAETHDRPRSEQPEQPGTDQRADAPPPD